jgi:hypothetical protein
VPVLVALVVGVAVTVGVPVAVAVGVAVLPNAIPVRLTFCVGERPLSVNVSVPVSVVPLALLSVVGLNVTET